MTKIYAGLALLMAFGCGSSDSFSVEGNVAGVGTQNLRVVYRAVPSGDLVTLKTTAIDNVFSFFGSAAEPTVVEIYASQKSPVAVFMAKNGDEIRLGSDGFVTGGRETVRFAESLAAMPTDDEDPSAVNDAVARYVVAHPGDIVAAALFAVRFTYRGDEERADSLLSLLSAPEYLAGDIRSSLLPVPDSVPSLAAVVAAGDTLAALKPGGRWIITASADERSRELIDSMCRWNQTMAVTDLFLGQDTVLWHRIIKSDSATWTQAIHPGGPAAFGVMRTPVAIDSDSLGAVVNVIDIRI